MASVAHVNKVMDSQFIRYGNVLLSLLLLPDCHLMDRHNNSAPLVSSSDVRCPSLQVEAWKFPQTPRDLITGINHLSPRLVGLTFMLTLVRIWTGCCHGFRGQDPKGSKAGRTNTGNKQRDALKTRQGPKPQLLCWLWLWFWTGCCPVLVLI